MYPDLFMQPARNTLKDLYPSSDTHTLNPVLVQEPQKSLYFSRNLGELLRMSLGSLSVLKILRVLLLYLNYI